MLDDPTNVFLGSHEYMCGDKSLSYDSRIQAMTDKSIGPIDVDKLLNHLIECHEAAERGDTTYFPIEQMRAALSHSPGPKVCQKCNGSGIAPGFCYKKCSCQARKSASGAKAGDEHKVGLIVNKALEGTRIVIETDNVTPKEYERLVLALLDIKFALSPQRPVEPPKTQDNTPSVDVDPNDEMDALAYAVLDNFICETVQDGKWVQARKEEYARLHAARSMSEQEIRPETPVRQYAVYKDGNNFNSPDHHETIFFGDLLPEIQALIRKGQATQRDYTPEEALAEARKRWGKGAQIQVHPLANGVLEYWVGMDICDCRHLVGGSFRAAFEAADKAEGKKA